VILSKQGYEVYKVTTTWEKMGASHAKVR
jgi:hypothetical protein